ncbi:type II toxin-antitoxin system Phd/YefM family antitoxin [Chelatococcus sp. XZ-Ab1]|uniref:type II toxin-antitoxin system Phd/YefM family antitoxin n=1 Tax=Chelatococcus sp. XZ-Ab1 TaxID=3034027 RepID=UPI0023E3801D|nr:type II toxin-antitoxin system Phd/YefM family antitoxin [Chelatococcus sp. XZ-Ab1]
MKTMSARDAKNAFGMMIDLARAEPVTIEKHGRPVVVVLSVEEFERLRVGSRHNGQPRGSAAPSTGREPDR